MGAIREYGRKTFTSLSIRNYRLYFIGQGISLCGTWMQTVALGWLVLTLTGSGTQLGTVLALQFLPLLFFAPWGGIIVDKFDKRHLLVSTQICLGLLSLAVSILVFSGAIALWMLYVVAFISGIIKVVDNPARQTFISEMVGNKHVKNAVSLSSMMANIARAIGPTIGGILIASIGLAFCFLFDAVSYIAVIVMLLYMRRSEMEGTVVKYAQPPRILDGFRYVREVPLISAILVMMAIVGTFAYEFSVSLPLLSQQTFLGDATMYAVLTSSFGIGSAIGGLFSAGRYDVSPRQLIVYTFLFGISILLAAVSPFFAFAAVVLVFVGFFSSNVVSVANTTVQLESKPEMRGRVMALWNMAIFGSTPIGGPIIGWVGEHIGARWALAVGGFATIAAAAFARRTLRKGGVLRPVTEEDELEVTEEGVIGSVKY